MLPAHVYDESMSEAQGQLGPAVPPSCRHGNKRVGSGRPGATKRAVQLGIPVTGGEEWLQRGCRRFQATDKHLSVDAVLRQTSELAVLDADRPDACRMTSTATCNRFLVNDILLGLEKPALVCHVGWLRRSVTLPLDLQSYKKNKKKKTTWTPGINAWWCVSRWAAHLQSSPSR